MAAILVKIGALALKTLAKPLSTHFTKYVMEHPTMRAYVINAAQRLHRIEIWITRSADGKTGKAFVGDLTEDKSIEMASKLASEGFVFGVGIAIVAFEYERQREKDVIKKKQETQERMDILEKAREERERLAKENHDQTRLIQTLMSRVDSLESTLQQRIDEALKLRAKPKGMFGGFFGPKAQPAFSTAPRQVSAESAATSQ